METRIGFKVVNQKLESYVAPRSTKVGRKYSTKRWTLPIHKQLPLMVFSSEEAARRFMENDAESSRLFRCEYVPSEYAVADRLYIFRDAANRLLEENTRFHRVLKERGVDIYKNWPDGTVFASRVRLLEEIKV